MNSRTKRRYEMQKKANHRKEEEIERLKEKIGKLESERNRKASLITSVEEAKGDLDITIKDLKKQYKECCDLISELEEMRSVIDKSIFKGRWKFLKPIVRLLLK